MCVCVCVQGGSHPVMSSIDSDEEFDQFTGSGSDNELEKVSPEIFLSRPVT